MPIKYIGRVTSFCGKPLPEMLYKLKNFGVGRIVYRNVFHERYQEPSYHIITRVEPFPETTRPETQVLISGRQIFRGRDLGEMAMKADFKDDWRLVPRDQESSFTNQEFQPVPEREVPSTVAFPPLLERMLIRDMTQAGEKVEEPPKLKLSIRNKKFNNARSVGQTQSTAVNS